MASAQSTKVVVVGAGVGGIITAIALKKQLGLEDFLIFEKAAEIGGTWRDNTYPGCACDIRAQWYSYSQELNPNWSHEYVGYAEIQEYWLGLVAKYDLRRFITFQTKLVGAEWDKESSLWHCKFESPGQPIQHVVTPILILATGPFSRPAYPDIPDIDKYQGTRFHSSNWNHDVNLDGKRVAVIGTGASAAQFVPELVNKTSAQITHFIRTPTWFMKRPNQRTSKIRRWLFANVPGANRTYRNWIWFQADLRWIAWKESSTFLRNIFAKGCLDYIYATAPEKYHKILAPTYTVGCKRIVPDPGYLKSLHHSNIELTNDPIVRFTDRGLVTKEQGSQAFDVVIFSTGFSLDPVDNIPIRGSEGLTLAEYYKKYTGGVPSSYLGIALPSFPNLFSLVGPNTATGHSSVIFAHETQINLIIQLIKPILSQNLTSVAVTFSEFRDYNDMIQRKLSETVWTHCDSYYRWKGNGKVFATFPGMAASLWWLARRPDWHAFEVQGTRAAQWLRTQKYTTVLRQLLAIILLVISIVSARKFGVILNSVRPHLLGAWRGYGGL